MSVNAPMGSAMIDLSEIDFSSSSPQTIDGLYDKVVTAFDSGKPVVVTGDWSELSGYSYQKCNTAFYTYITYSLNNDNKYYIHLPAGYSVVVAANDSVSITE